MTFTGIMILLIIAAIFATLAQFITGYSDIGWIVSALLGFAGAFIGLWLAGRFKLPPVIKFYVGAQPFPLVWILIFSGLFVLIVILVQRSMMRRYN